MLRNNLSLKDYVLTFFFFLLISFSPFLILELVSSHFLDLYISSPMMALKMALGLLGALIVD